jgi:hypothetical protein
MAKNSQLKISQLVVLLVQTCLFPELIIGFYRLELVVNP